MPTPKDLPKGMRGLWRVQYEPREKKLLKMIEKEQVPIYKKLKWSRKITIIDNAEQRGSF